MSKPPRAFTVDGIGDLDDGRARLVIDDAIARIMNDLDDRPYLTKARTIDIRLEMKPEVSDRGGLKGVHTAVSVRTKAPATELRTEFMPTSVHGDQIVATMPADRAAPLFGGPGDGDPS